MNKSLKEIRESEKRSHEAIYLNETLYKSDGWQKKPINTVLELIPLFRDYNELNILDLGCGVGRNVIPFATEYNDKCHADCVDILKIAIEKLDEAANTYNVRSSINGIVSAIEDFYIARDKYDLIMAISALEHIDSRNSFESKLKEISSGLKHNGIVCLVINTDVSEFDKLSKKSLPAQFEVNLKADELKAILDSIFNDFEVLKYTVREQAYDIPRDSLISELHTNVLTFVARKGF